MSYKARQSRAHQCFVTYRKNDGALLIFKYYVSVIYNFAVIVMFLRLVHGKTRFNDSDTDKKIGNSGVNIQYNNNYKNSCLDHFIKMFQKLSKSILKLY